MTETDNPKPLDLTAFDGHTPGPWGIAPPKNDGPPEQWLMDPVGNWRFHKNTARAVGVYGPQQDHPVLVAGLYNGSPAMQADNAVDLALILAAPDLLAEVKRLRAEVEALRDSVRYLQRPPLPHMQTIEALEADKSYVEHQLAQPDNDTWGTVRLMWQSRLAEINRQIAGWNNDRD